MKMRKSAIASIVITVLLLAGGIGLIVFGLTAGPETVRYADEWSFFSFSYSYSFYDSMKAERLFDLGRTLVTCGIVMLGFSLILSERKDGRHEEPKAGNGDCGCGCNSKAEGPRVRRESEKTAEEEKAAEPSEARQIPDPETVIHL